MKIYIDAIMWAIGAVFMGASVWTARGSEGVGVSIYTLIAIACFSWTIWHR